MRHFVAHPAHAEREREREREKERPGWSLEAAKLNP